jgi:hypothetical protein
MKKNNNKTLKPLNKIKRQKVPNFKAALKYFTNVA